MAKSANDYYAEKMRRLLEKQAQNDAARQTEARRLAPPPAKRAPQRESARDADGGTSRDYYNSFRTRVGDAQYRPGQSVRTRSGQAVPPARNNTRPAPAGSGARPAQSRENQKGRGPETGGSRGYTAPRADYSAPKAPPKRKIPEQTVADRRREEEQRVESLRKARRGRRMRKLRDGLISFFLIVAVFSVLCVVVYRLLFVIRDISADGSEIYTGEEIVAASGVGTGDHLYSFSSRIVGDRIKLNCPEIDTVDVTRKAPNTITFDVTEEAPAYYADFYGEIRELSPTLRVLNTVSEEKAKEKMLVKLMLPAVSEALAGEKIVFSSLRSDDYIYNVLETVNASALNGRVGSVNLESQYSVKITCDGRYLLLCGDSSKMETKLRIADAVLSDDETFNGQDKAQIDLSDLGKTSVIIDNQLVID